MAFYKKITLAALILISVKAIGILREGIFIWYLGINTDTSLIMMMNVIPAAMSGFLRYSSINLLIYLRFSKKLDKIEAEEQIRKLFLIVILISFAFIPFNTEVGLKHIGAYLLYSFAAILYAAIGYEEYSLLGKSERLIIGFAALAGAVISIIVVLVGSNYLEAFILPVATLVSAIVNYLLIPSKSVLFKKTNGVINHVPNKLKDSIISIAPIVIIEMIGMMFSIADLAAIKSWGLDPVVFQYNYYASMIYSFPVMIVGMAISSQLLDLDRINSINKIFEKYAYIITLFLLLISMSIYIIVSYFSIGFFKFIKFINPSVAMDNIKEVVDLFSIYSAGIFPAIFIFTITKIFLSKYKAGKIALTYFIALTVKVVVIFLGGYLSYDVKEVIPFSTVTGWTALVLTFAVYTRYDKFK